MSTHPAPGGDRLVHSPSSSRSFGRSFGGGVMVMVWSALATYLLITLTRGMSLRDDAVALPALVFFAVSAVIGSRLWLAAHDRWGGDTSDV